MDNKLGLQNMKVKSSFLRSILPPAVKDQGRSNDFSLGWARF
jgi:hypothetical protein